MKSTYQMLSVLFFGLVSTSAFAADSEWLLCDNGKVAVNSFESRWGADGRATDLTMLIGKHRFSGRLVNEDAGQVSLTTLNGNSSFSGYLSIDYSKKTLSLQGELSLDGAPSSAVDSVLTCKVMQ